MFSAVRSSQQLCDVYDRIMIRDSQNGCIRSLKHESERSMLRKHTVCTHVQVDPHISRPSLLGVKKMSKIQDPRISRPPVYRLVSDVADAINSVPRDAAVQTAGIYCDEINS